MSINFYNQYQIISSKFYNINIHLIAIAIYYFILLFLQITAIIYAIKLFRRKSTRQNSNINPNYVETPKSEENLSLLNNDSTTSSQSSIKTEVRHNYSLINSKVPVNKYKNDQCSSSRNYSNCEIQTYPLVTIIKPLVGFNENLEQNLSSFFHQTYPNYEIKFCVPSFTDSAIPICKKVIQKYKDSKSKIDVKLYKNIQNVGTNPKINNMITAWRDAKNESNSSFIWICDANIYVEPETLSNMMERINLDKKNAICHGMPFVKSDGCNSFGQQVEKTYFGTQHARHYLFWNLFGLNCMNGQSTLINLNIFDRVIGDLSRLGKFVAEDYFMGEFLWNAGYKLILSNYPILSNRCHNNEIEEETALSRWYIRMIRWTRLRMTMIPLVSLLEPFSECVLSGVIVSILLEILLWDTPFYLAPCYVFPLHLFLWFILDLTLQYSIDKDVFKNVNFLQLCSCWIVREFITIQIQITSVFNIHKVRWGNQNFNVASGSGHSSSDNNSRNTSNEQNR